MTMADEKLLMVMVAVTDMAKAKAFYTEGWNLTLRCLEKPLHI